MNKDSLTENFIARQIVTEIMNFGVTQKQILQIIYLLSLEIEDREKSIAIANLAKENGSKETKKTGLIVDP
jgi:hypothetical protein